MKTKFDGYLYNRLPKIYREFDREFTLKHFLSIFETQLGITLESTQELLDLINVDKCPPEYIPLLCETLGVNYEPDIPISYQRRFLKNAVALNKRKGTLSAIKYLSRELFEKDVNVYMQGKKIKIDIEDDMGNLGPYSEKRILERYIKYYMPVSFELESIFYLTLNPIEYNSAVIPIYGELTTIYPKK